MPLELSAVVICKDAKTGSGHVRSAAPLQLAAHTKWLALDDATRSEHMQRLTTKLAQYGPIESFNLPHALPLPSPPPHDPSHLLSIEPDASELFNDLLAEDLLAEDLPVAETPAPPSTDMAPLALVPPGSLPTPMHLVYNDDLMLQQPLVSMTSPQITALSEVISLVQALGVAVGGDQQELVAVLSRARGAAAASQAAQTP